MSTDVHDDLPPDDQAIILEAARIGAIASRRFAAEAELTGVAVLKAAGMQVFTGIDRTGFAAAMASATPAFERMFGRQPIEQIRRAA
jgi:TRAP-type C4-dicarboxylate transport system substrate-binding protein